MKMRRSHWRKFIAEAREKHPEMSKREIIEKLIVDGMNAVTGHNLKPIGFRSPR